MKIPDSFVPVLRFSVCSDVHVTQAGDERCSRLENMLKKSYELSEADKTCPRLDAVIAAGDLVNSGTECQFDAFFDIIRAGLKDGTRFLCVTAKYHDCTQGRVKDIEYCRSLSGNEPDFHTVINGFHFIGISVCPDDTVFHYSDAQTQWLDEEIGKAVTADPDRPVFVIQHEHVRSTVYGSYPEDGWGEIYFTDILKKYPNVIHISGHSHYPASDPRAIWQGEFTALNAGGLSYYEFTFDGERKYHPENSQSMAQFVIIEAGASSDAAVRVFDLNENKVVKEYYIPDVRFPGSFIYTNEKRTVSAAAPFFPADAEISVKKSGDGYILSFPPAVCPEDDAVFLYRYSVTDKSGTEVLKDRSLSDYYYRSKPEQVSVFLELPEGEYTFSVAPESVWGKTGGAITRSV